MSAIDNFTSEIRLLAGSRLPQHWLHCDGQSLSVADNEPLFEQIGYRYGGSGGNFSLPRIADKGPSLRYMICTLGIKPNSDFALGTLLMSEIRYIAGLPNGTIDAIPARGQRLPLEQFPALFSILGLRFGGNGTSNFQLPTLPELTPASGPAIPPLIGIAGIYPQRDNYYSDAYTSEVRQMALEFTARGWFPCQGQLVPAGGNAALFSLVLDRFGQSNLRQFFLPTIPDSGGVPFFIDAQGVYPDPD